MAMRTRRVAVHVGHQHGGKLQGGGSGGGGGGGLNIPTGVVFQDIDGNTGVNSVGLGSIGYFGANGFSVAAQTRIWNPNATAPNPTVTYAGWDDPAFISICVFLPPMDTQADCDRWGGLGLNTATGLRGNQSINQLTLMGGNGLSLIMNLPDYGAFARAGHTVGNETVGWYTQDEPQTVDQMIRVPLLGTTTATCTNASISGGTFDCSAGTVTGGPIFPTIPDSLHNGTYSGTGVVGTQFTTGYAADPRGGNGIYSCNFTGTSTSGVTITVASIPALTSGEIGGRFIDTGLAGNTFFSNNPLVMYDFSALGNVNFSSAINNNGSNYTASDGSHRSVSCIGYDTYWFLFAQDGTPVNGLRQGGMNQYQPSQPPFTVSQCAKGTHYGNLLDVLRKDCHTAGITVPLWPALDNSESNGGVRYDTQGVEMNWSAWGSLIHGARALFWFNSSDVNSPSGGGPDDFNSTFMKTVQSVTFTGTISGSTLTVAPGAVSSGLIYPGMVASSVYGIGSGVTGTAVVLQQITPQPATFVASVAGGSTSLVVSSVSSGSIVVPSWITGPSNMLYPNASTNMKIVAGPGGGGAGTYTLNASPSASAIPSETMNSIACNPGADGTFQLGGGGTGSGTLVFTQTNIGMGGNGTPMFLGGAPSQKGMTDCGIEINKRVREMAPVLNSPFAVCNTGHSLGPGQGYVIAATPSLSYCFPSDTGVKNSFPPRSAAFALLTGMDVCAHLFQGTPYPLSSGETISQGFYIFATTRQPETSMNIAVTISINDPFATSITVLGEGRNLATPTGLGTNNVTFSDTFDHAWTTRIYRVNH